MSYLFTLKWSCHEAYENVCARKMKDNLMTPLKNCLWFIFTEHLILQQRVAEMVTCNTEH